MCDRCGMAQVIPYPADVYYLALEEYLLLNALRLRV